MLKAKKPRTMIKDGDVTGKGEFLAEKGWIHLADLLQKARAGDDKAFTTACEMIDQKLKRQVKAIVRQTGVRPEESVHDAWQEAMLAFVKHYQQVETIRHLPYWLAITGRRAALKNRWPRYSKKKKKEQMVGEVQQQPPEPIGTKPITIAGREYQVKIYAPGDPTAAPNDPRPRLEALTESTIEKLGKTIFPDYVEQIHQERTLAEATAALKKALEQLPPRWKLAIQLVYFDEKTVTDAAKALGINRQRLHKLLKMGRRRLRRLLANAACDGKAASRTTRREKPVDRRETWVVGPYHDEISRGIDASEQSDLTATDAWWPQVLESLHRYAEAVGFDGAEFVGQEEIGHANR